MPKFKKILLSFLVLFCVGALQAQEMVAANKPEMADVMRSNGKIYVVVAVVITIVAGLFLYLVRIDRKVSRLEKQQ